MADYTKPVERLLLYKKVIRHMRENKIDKGMCAVIYDIAYDGKGLNVPHIQRHLPELWAQKPVTMFDSLFWFKPGRKTPRLKALKDAMVAVQVVIDKQSKGK